MKAGCIVPLLAMVFLSGCSMRVAPWSRYYVDASFNKNKTIGQRHRTGADTNPVRSKPGSFLKEAAVNAPTVAATRYPYSGTTARSVKHKTPAYVSDANATSAPPLLINAIPVQAAVVQDQPYVVPLFTMGLAIGGLVAVALGFYFLGLTGTGLVAGLVASACLFLGSATVLLIRELRFDPLKTKHRGGGYWGQLLNVLIVSAAWFTVFRVLYSVGSIGLRVLVWFENL